MKTKFQLLLIGAVFGITFLSAVAFHSKKNAPVTLPVQKEEQKTTHQARKDTLPIDSLLPDSTRAKMKKAEILGKKLDEVTQKALTKNKQDEKQNAVLESQTNQVSKFVQQSPFVQPLPPKESGSDKVQLKDSVPLFVPEEKRGFFNRIFHRKK